MRIHSFIKVFVAALTIAFAVSMGTVPVSAQTRPETHPEVLPLNVTQVRLTCNPTDVSDMWCGIYDKIAPTRWVLRMKDGKTFQFVDYRINNVAGGGNFMLKDASRDVVVSFNFISMVSNAGMTVGGRQRVVFGTITGFYESSSDNSPETCSPVTTARGAKCNCDLRTLRPLQGAVGMEEVRKKKEDIEDTNKIVTGKKTRLDLAYDPIKIVLGPDGLYVTDHHHGALAWLKAGHTMGTCQTQPESDIISNHREFFWYTLKTRNLVWLKDKNGRTITENQLPTTLEALPDDPYRTLAWRVRKGDKDVPNDEGFCRGLMEGNKEFAEFQWADWLRKRPEFQNPPGPTEDWSKKKRKEAIALAKTPAASGLPGYRSDLSVACPPDPD